MPIPLELDSIGAINHAFFIVVMFKRWIKFKIVYCFPYRLCFIWKQRLKDVHWNTCSLKFGKSDTLTRQDYIHCVKSVRIGSYSGQHFPAFGLNTQRYFLSLRIKSKCGKMLTRITPNTDTFHAVITMIEKINIIILVI